MLSQSKAQQQYANHLRLTRSYKYLSFETQRSSNLAELRSSEIRACYRLTSPHQSEMHRQRNDCSQNFPVEQVLATRHTDSALITALELSQRLLLTFGKVCAAEASLGNQIKVAVPISLHLGRPLTSFDYLSEITKSSCKNSSPLTCCWRREGQREAQREAQRERERELQQK